MTRKAALVMICLTVAPILGSAECPPSAFPFDFHLPPHWGVVSCETLGADPDLWFHPAIRAVPLRFTVEWKKAVERGDLQLFVRVGPTEPSPTAVTYVPSSLSPPSIEMDRLGDLCNRIEKNMEVSNSLFGGTALLHGCHEVEVSGFPTLYVEKSNLPNGLWMIEHQVFFSSDILVVLATLCPEGDVQAVREEVELIVNGLSPRANDSKSHH